MNIDKTLDTIHSMIVRLRATDEDGRGRCPLCKERFLYSTSVCGHYIKRRNLRWRWSFLNTVAICPLCNGKEESTIEEPLRDYLYETIGEQKVDCMEFEAKLSFKIYKHEKLELLKSHREICRELAKDKNFGIAIP